MQLLQDPKNEIHNRINFTTWINWLSAKTIAYPAGNITRRAGDFDAPAT